MASKYRAGISRVKTVNIVRALNSYKKIGSYFIVGLIATFVEWGCYRYLSHVLGVNYLVATVLAIIISTFSNWLFGRLLTFKESGEIKLVKELSCIYLISVIGLLLNVVIMWILHGLLGLWDMGAKVVATGLVFFYNYYLRVLFVYREQE